MIATLVAFACAVLLLRATARSRRRSRWRRVLLVRPRPSVRTTVRRAGRVAGGVLVRRRGLSILAGAVVGAVVGSVLGGPIAGMALAGYGAAASAMARRRLVSRAHGASRRAAADAVVALSAELRAGQHLGPAIDAAASALTGSALIGPEAEAVARRVRAAVDVAESSGAALADVLDRLDGHLCAADRARVAAGAQAAGTRVSALLLATMPVAGPGLAATIGVDPLPVLLRSRLGAACLFAAVVLQLAGLVWAGRLSRIEVAL